MVDRNIKIYVSGQVQGVGFRYFTYQQAHKRNLTGYVYNLEDGRVEIVACGSQANIEALLLWLDQGGPLSAKIAQYHVYPYNGEQYTQFTIKH